MIMDSVDRAMEPCPCRFRTFDPGRETGATLLDEAVDLVAPPTFGECLGDGSGIGVAGGDHGAVETFGLAESRDSIRNGKLGRA